MHRRDPPVPMPASISFDQLLARCGLPRLEARALMSLASGRPREWLIAHGPDLVEPALRERFEALVLRRHEGEPIAYLAGVREFHGHRFEVGPAVLIPRPETEQLVDLVIDQASPGAWVLDLGTGSGAIAVSVARARPDLHMTATDRSPESLAVARRNAQTLLGEAQASRIAWHEGDWWSALPAGAAFDVIVSNPPYIAQTDPHLAQGDLRFEPHGALAAGADGLADLRTLVAGAPQYLRPGGLLALEHGWDQGAAVRGLMRAAGFVALATLRDAQQHERITLGRIQANVGRSAVPGLE